MLPLHLFSSTADLVRLYILSVSDYPTEREVGFSDHRAKISRLREVGLVALGACTIVILAHKL